jgi:hypothetical protein
MGENPPTTSSVTLRPSHIPVADILGYISRHQQRVEFFCADYRDYLAEMSKETTRSGTKQVNFSEQWSYADIAFVVEGKRLWACRAILAMWSPVFEAMFGSNFKEKNASEIELPGKKYDDVNELLAVIHPPNKEISSSNIKQLLPLLQEYQIDTLMERCEDFLCNEPSSISQYAIAQQYNLKRLRESVQTYLRRAPVSRLRAQQADWDELDPAFVKELLMERCERFETHLDALREVRMVLERKRPTTFPGQHLLCAACTAAREQQVDCNGCMRSCCQKLTEVLRNLER